ncbi:putative serine acetyltransferase 2 [Capsicum baccatum]|uniref:Serine acetyltransferase 2 n=1 Tax=Capsicum baccatum TaxID=33114 RepID=A0A2G2XHE6_CAPBA|nr:putative serine acetyltransferase 2 [Capsicum baccatum]
MLNVPMSTIASESVFSQGRQQLGDNRNSLGSNAMNVLVCLRDWIRAEIRNQGMEPEPSDELKLEEIMTSRENSAESNPMHGFGLVDFEYPMQSVTLVEIGKETGHRHLKIGQGAFIGASVTILGNIKVGEGAMVGADSLVMKDVPLHSMVTGIPAKVVGYVDDHIMLHMHVYRSRNWDHLLSLGSPMMLHESRRHNSVADKLAKHGQKLTPSSCFEASESSNQKEGWVVCRVFNKKNYHKALESPQNSSAALSRSGDMFQFIPHTDAILLKGWGGVQRTEKGKDYFLSLAS